MLERQGTRQGQRKAHRKRKREYKRKPKKTDKELARKRKNKSERQIKREMERKRYKRETEQEIAHKRAWCKRKRQQDRGHTCAPRAHERARESEIGSERKGEDPEQGLGWKTIRPREHAFFLGSSSSGWYGPHTQQYARYLIHFQLRSKPPNIINTQANTNSLKSANTKQKGNEQEGKIRQRKKEPRSWSS